MSEVTQQGRKALVKVAEWLEAGAPHVTLPNDLQVDRFDMESPVVVDEYESCGTSCCIAGAVCQFQGLGLAVRGFDGGLDWCGQDGARELAGSFLNISEDERDRLFEPWNHFMDDSESYNSAPRGAAVIRHFLLTGEVDWDRFDDNGKVYEEE